MQLRDKLAALEQERDDAWALAEELEGINDKLANPDSATIPQSARNSNVNPTSPHPPTTPGTPSSSARSSRVSMARKASTRTSKAGLRSPSRQRSARSSVASSFYRNSMASASPGLRSGGEIPPVPPIPTRMPLGIVTDLPSGSAGIASEITPLSESRALLEAQRELCDMLGITADDLQSTTSLPRRRSMSSMAPGAASPTPRTRSNSEVLSPAKVDDRMAMLEKLGMVPHEF